MNVLASSLVLVALMATVYAECGPPLCQTGYLYREHACYMLYDEAKPWAAAEQRCVDDGGHLASVHSAAENDFLNKLSQQGTAGSRETWIGFQDNQVEGSFSWTDESPVDYTNWPIPSGEPNDVSPGEDCTELNFFDVSGTWNDHFCTQEHRFICKMLPGP